MIEVQTYQTLDQAARAIDNNATYLGGGTLVMRALNYGQQDFQRIIRSTDSTLKQISDQGQRITIGAGVTMSEIIASPQLQFIAPVARSVGGPAIRNMATVGGNLFAKHPYGDFTVALLALEGIIKMDNGSEIDLEQFLSSRDNSTGLVSSVSITKPNADDFKYKKVSRVKPKGISVMSIAVWKPNQYGNISNIRIAFGAMSDTPKRAKATEQALEGKSLDAAQIEPALKSLENDFSPPEDAIASSWYRSQIAPVHLRRLLLGEGN